MVLRECLHTRVVARVCRFIVSTDSPTVYRQLWTSIDQPDRMLGVFPRALRGLHSTEAEGISTAREEIP